MQHRRPIEDLLVEFPEGVIIRIDLFYPTGTERIATIAYDRLDETFYGDVEVQDPQYEDFIRELSEATNETMERPIVKLLPPDSSTYVRLMRPTAMDMESFVE